MTLSPWLIQTLNDESRPENNFDELSEVNSVLPYSLKPVFATSPPSNCAMT